METNKSKIFICKDCNLSYATRTGLWKHNTKYHPDIIGTKIQSKYSNPIPKYSENVKKIPNYICKYCKNNFVRKFNLQRHQKNCKDKNENKEELELLKNIIDNMNKTQEKLVKEIMELKKDKNKSIQNNTSKSQNINNGSIYNGRTINNININAPGHELMKLSKEDIEDIFEKKLMSVITYIEKTNFDKKKKYNHNFCATNQNGKYLLHYDQESSSIKSTKKKYFYQDVISNAIQKIETSYNKYKNKFKKDKQLLFDEIITKLKAIQNYDFNNKILKSLYDELNLLCYNSRNVVLDTWSINENIDEEKEKDYSEYFLKIKSVVDTYSNMQNNSSSDDNSSDSDSSDSGYMSSDTNTKKKLIFNKKKIIKKLKESSSDNDIEV